MGRVSDPLGVPQMGATVLLYNRFDRVLQRVLTSDRGTFGFESLSPDVYAIRVSLASFLPALKRNILVQPGEQSLLNVNLASVFSSIELVNVSPGQTSIMSDDWKWVLRSSSSTRPVLRLLPELKKPSVRKSSESAAIFSDTRGMVKVSGGDQGSASDLGGEPDLGTAFALATSFLGGNQLQVSGNVGYSGAYGAPTAGFRTSFRREMEGGFRSPEVKLTMRQLALPARVGAGALGESPVLRTLSATMLDSKQLTETVRLEYGMSMDSVTFLDRLNYFSTYSRLSWDRAPGESFRIGYASGTPPVEAFLGEHESDVELQQDLSAVALFPRVSLRAGDARVQRTQTIEAGYRKKIGSRVFAGSVYTDDVSNAAVTMVGGGELPFTSAELLPDLLSNSWTLNAGRYHSLGYMASVTQVLGDHFDVTMAYGSGGALMVDPRAAASSAEGLRSVFRTDRRHTLTARASGTLPGAGTQFVTSYQWADLASLNPAHMFLTQSAREGMGLNFRLNQPLPYFGGLPGRLELSAEVRNLLAQGYVPLIYNGRRMYLMQTARSVRGGISFIF
ncbi:MAG TPA: carboxypeptidase-like regulatory domain-containing protein [Bryobacteraceae bacterium]